MKPQTYTGRTQPIKTAYAQCRKSLLRIVGLGGVEPPTSRLSGVRSNHLSYRPSIHFPYRTTRWKTTGSP